jgi:hypothetical protein
MVSRRRRSPRRLQLFLPLQMDRRHPQRPRRSAFRPRQLTAAPVGSRRLRPLSSAFPLRADRFSSRSPGTAHRLGKTISPNPGLCRRRARLPRIHFGFPSPLLSTLGLLLAAVVLTDYTLSLQAKSFRYNAYDVISRDLYEAIANDARSRGFTNDAQYTRSC